MVVSFSIAGRKSNKNKERSVDKARPYNTWAKESYDKFRDYQVNYYKENYRTFAIKLNREKDPDVIEFLENVESIPQFVRKAVRAEIKNRRSRSLCLYEYYD